VQNPPRSDEELVANGELSELPEQDIAAFAYRLWIARGCPIGSPNDDWFQAEAELKGKFKVLTAAG
jgi:hypothetical protein